MILKSMMIRFAAVACVLLFAAAAAHAQEKYPTEPIRLMTPFAAGGPPEEFLNRVKSDVEKWKNVVKRAKIIIAQ